MLVLDILDDRVPAPIIVDQIAIARGIDNVQAKSDTVLLDDMGNRVNLSSRSNDFFRLQSTLRLDEVGCEDSVDQGRLAQPCLAYSTMGQCDVSRH